jgi:hypothetical protein
MMDVAVCFSGFGHHSKGTRMRTRCVVAIIAFGLIWNILSLAQPVTGKETTSGHPRTVRDILWVWGNAEMARGNDAEHTFATFAESSPARRAELLGTPNALMAGDGIPNDQQLARAQTESVKRCRRIVWEIMPDGSDNNTDMAQLYKNCEYKQRTIQIHKLKDEYPQIEGVLLDDMTSVAVDQGFKPEHIRALKQHLASGKQSVDVWGVFYTMNFGRENINKYISELDVINLWTWDAKDIVNLEKNVAYCRKTFPGKPIMLGLYLYDYGNGGGAPRRIPMDLLKLQCETALKLAKDGRIAGIVFLTIDNDPGVVQWTSDWIKRVADQPLPNK